MAKILHQFNVEAPTKKIFEAFTSQDGLNSWWTLQSAGKPEKGNIYTFYFGEKYDWRAEVVKVNRTSLTWKMTQAMDDWMPTKVGFKLVKNGKNSTTVQFSHDGWRKANEHFAITSFCWGQLLQGLKNFVETGAVVPFEKRN